MGSHITLKRSIDYVYSNMKAMVHKLINYCITTEEMCTAWGVSVSGRESVHYGWYHVFSLWIPLLRVHMSLCVSVKLIILNKATPNLITLFWYWFIPCKIYISSRTFGKKSINARVWNCIVISWCRTVTRIFEVFTSVYSRKVQAGFCDKIFDSEKNKHEWN